MRIALAALALAGTAAAAQQPTVPVPGAGQAAGPENVRVNQLFVYGNDPCPQSEDLHEVTICVVLSEDDRFRVPPNLRQNPNEPASQSWANRAIQLSYEGRSGIGSCSPTGPGGMVGCFNQLVSQARAERAGADEVNWARMIEEARQRRLSQIDEQAREAEAAAQAAERGDQPD